MGAGTNEGYTCKGEGVLFPPHPSPKHTLIKNIPSVLHMELKHWIYWISFTDGHSNLLDKEKCLFPTIFLTPCNKDKRRCTHIIKKRLRFFNGNE